LHKSLEDPNYRRFLTNAILWSAEKVTANAAASR
jgi:hypothetical protein